MYLTGLLAQAGNTIVEPVEWAGLDWLTLGLFFAGLFLVVWWVIKQKEETSTDYFLAGRNAGWIAIGASIFASNIGSEHLVGLAGTGAESGLAMSHWEIQAWLILVLGWVFVPFYARSKVFTMPEFLEKRYCGGARSFLSIISLVSYVLTKVAVTVYAGGIVFTSVLGRETIPLFGMEVNLFWFSAIGLVIITGLYTVIGGMKAVLYTSVLQTPVLLLGSVVILFVGLSQLGAGEGLLAGWETLVETTGDKLHVIKPASHPKFPWTGVLLGSAIIGFWYWCTDQYIVQRVLSAPNQKVARRGSIFGAYLKLTPVFIFMFPGLIAYALHAKSGGTFLPVENGDVRYDAAFPTLVASLLPLGIKGVVVGGLVAALMSSLASLFNSSATLFTVDFYKRYKPDKSERHYVVVGRVATLVVVVLGILWVPVMTALGKVLYEYLQDVQSLIAPGIAAAFIMGVFSRKTTAKAGLWGLIIGFALGMSRLLSRIITTLWIIPAEDKAAKGYQFSVWVAQKAENPEGLNFIERLLVYFMDINWLHYCVFLLFLCLAVMWIVSRFTTQPRREQIEGLTYGSATSEQSAETRESWNKWDVIHTVIILAIVLAFYIRFW